MALSKNKQKALNSLLDALTLEISDILHSDTLNYIKLAVGSPSNLSDNDFVQQIGSLDNTVKEKLIELRDIYLNMNPGFIDSDPENMKKTVQAYVINKCNAVSKDAAPKDTHLEQKSNVVEVVDSPLQYLVKTLNLKPGDIVISEMPFTNASQHDFENFESFVPGHTSVWTGEKFDRPFAHSVREGYRPPGLKTSSLWDGRHIVFRYQDNPKIANQASSMIRSWASAETSYTKEKYQQTYPQKFWERHQKDLINYFGDERKSSQITGPATPYGGARAFFDIADLGKNQELATLGEEGLRRAIKFAAVRDLGDASVSKKGQRCTPIVIAAYQASILAPIVIAQTSKIPFKKYKGQPFLEYADQVLIPNWRNTPLGQALLHAIKTKDYSAIFPAPFAVDQRYALPKNLYAQLQNSIGFEQIGKFSYFKGKLLLIENEPVIQATQATILKKK